MVGMVTRLNRNVELPSSLSQLLETDYCTCTGEDTVAEETGDSVFFKTIALSKQIRASEAVHVVQLTLSRHR